MEPVKIGNYLRQLRKEKGLTQEQLAQRLHVSDRTVSRWETGVNLPDLDILLKLSEFYGVGVQELLEGQPAAATGSTPDSQILNLVARYSQDRERERMNRFFLVAASSIVALGVSFLTCLTLLRSSSGGVTVLVSTLLLFLAYSGIMYAIPYNRTATGFPVILLSGFLAAVASNIIILLMHFSDETIRWQFTAYQDGAFTFSVIFTAFFIAGIVTCLVNRKR